MHLQYRYAFWICVIGLSSCLQTSAFFDYLNIGKYFGWSKTQTRSISPKRPVSVAEKYLPWLTTKTRGISTKGEGTGKRDPRPTTETEGVSNELESSDEPLPSSQTEAICSSAECQEAAKRIKLYMDRTVDKCQNFYQFACGNFPQHMKIPKDEVEISSVTELKKRVYSQVKGVLEAAPRGREADGHPFAAVRDLYRLCMDEKSIDARGVAPALTLLKKAGGWPLLTPGQWNPADWDYARLMTTLWTLGADHNSILNLEISQGYLKVDQPKLALPLYQLREGMSSPAVMEYYQYMQKVALLFGVEDTTDESHLKRVMIFEIQLAQIMRLPEERRYLDMLSQKYSLRQTANFGKWLDWPELVKTMLAQPEPNRDDRTILIYDATFIHYLGNLVSQTEKLVVVNYMVWRAVHGMVSWLTTALRSRQSRLYSHLKVEGAVEPRWQQCVRAADKLQYALTALFVKTHAVDANRAPVVKMAKHIQKEIKLDFDKLGWMDKTTRKDAVLKNKKIAFNISFSDEFKSKRLAKVEEYYEGLIIDNKNYFEAIIDIERWQRLRQRQLLLDDRTGDDITSEPITSVKALYEPDTNSLNLAANVLQPPFFSTKLPDYLNYAAIGVVIARELIHAFDEKGGKVSHDGNKACQWWSAQTLDDYVDKADCIKKLYEDLIVANQVHLDVDLDNTRYENIADVAGLKLAYSAYKRHHRGPQPALPGLAEYNSDQLFLLAHANLQCDLVQPTETWARLRNDVTAPAELRVNAPVMDFPELEDVFGCEKGSLMNPKEKCEIW